MLQKCVSLTLSLALLGIATPVFAGDEIVPLFSPDAASAAPFKFQPPANLNLFSPGVAFAPRFQTPGQTSPQSAPTPSPRDPSNHGKLFKWLGIAMMGGGGALIGRGAAISNPCSAYQGPGVLCTSNYQEVRISSFAVGGALAATGLVLFFHGRHKN